MINNTGQGVYASFTDTSEEQFDQLMNTHFKGVFFLTQTLLPLMADQSRIVNISTGLTRFAIPGYTACAAIKGAIETDFGGGAVSDNAELNTYITSQIALGLVGQPDDIGGVIASLLSEDNRWINAQSFEASGGMFT